MTNRTPDRPAFDLVIFDLDGTLVDSLPDIAGALNATLVHAGEPTLPVATIAAFVGDGAPKLIERAFPKSATDPKQQAILLDWFMTAYADAVCVRSSLYPGVANLLTSLDQQGVAAAVLTNKPGALARTLLDRLFVAGRFKAIIGDGDGFARKPDPGAALTLMKRVGASSARTVIVGDGLADVRLARAIPCPSIAAAWGYTPLARLQAEAPTFAAASVADARQILLPAPVPAATGATETKDRQSD